MRLAEVPYLEAAPYPTMFGPGSSKPLPRKFRRRTDCKRKVDMDKVVHVDTFKGLLEEDVQDETSPTPSPTVVELVELVFAADLKVVTLARDLEWLWAEGGCGRKSKQRCKTYNSPSNDGKFDPSDDMPFNEAVDGDDDGATKKFQKPKIGKDGKKEGI